MRIQELEPATFIKTLEPEWDSFRQQAESSLAFLDPRYVACWLPRLEPGAMAHLVTAWDGEELVGYAPLAETPDAVGPFEEPTLRFLGNNLGFPGDLMYADVLARDPQREVVQGILAYAHEEWKVPKWNLGFIHPGSAIGSIAAALFGLASGDASFPAQPYVSLDLPASLEAYLAGLSANVRQNHGRRLRRLKSEGDLQITVDREPSTVGKRMREMLENHRRWWEGTEREGWFGDAETRAFLVSCAETLASLGHGMFFTLELDGHPISWNAGCLDDGRYFEQLISFDRDYASYSPGVLLSVEIFRHLIDRGVRRVELGPGLNERKRALGGTVTAYRKIEGYARTPPLKSRLVRRLRGRSRAH